MFLIKIMSQWQNQQGLQHPLHVKVSYCNTNKIWLLQLINHGGAMWIKFLDHSWLFCHSLKKLAIVERLFWQLGMHCSGRCCCREVAIVERFKQGSMYGLSTAAKKKKRPAIVERWSWVEVDCIFLCQKCKSLDISGLFQTLCYCCAQLNWSN